MRPGDQAVALLFLLECDRRRWQDDHFRAAYNAGQQAAPRSTMVDMLAFDDGRCRRGGVP